MNKLLLHKINISKELSNTDLNSVDKFNSIKHYKKSDIISNPDDKGKVYFIIHGRVKEYVSDKNSTYILSILRKGEIFGDFGIDMLPKLYVEALDNATIRILKTEQFNDMVTQDSKLLKNLFEYVYMKLQSTQEKLISSTHDTVAVKLIKLLIQLSKPICISSNDFITEKFTHNELAQMLGVSRQTITVTINKLVKTGLLKKINRVYIFEKHKLITYADNSPNKLGIIKLKLKQISKT